MLEAVAPAAAARTGACTLAATDGTSLRMRRYGSGGLPCVFVHGFAESASVWDAFIRSAMSTQAMIAIDQRGHGDSGWSADGVYDAARLVDDLRQVVDTLALDRFVLVGHSLGGNIAARLCAMAPGRVAGLVMIDTAPVAGARARVHLLREFADSAGPYASVAEYAERLALQRPLAAPRLLRSIAEQALRADPAGGLRLKADPRIARLLATDAGEDESSFLQVLRQIVCPVLMLRGALSGVVSQDAALGMTHALRAARLQVVAAAGHSVMLDNPAGFRDALAPFLASFAGAG